MNYQYKFFSDEFRHGGEVGRGKRKVRRPIVVKRPMHLVLRSEKAKKDLELTNIKHRKRIEEQLQKYSKRYKVELYERAIVQNHIHLLVRARSRKEFQTFLRVIAGRIAQLVTMAVKAKAFGRFWTDIAFTRIVNWGKDLKEVRNYIIKNDLEARGIIPYSPRKLKDKVPRSRGAP